LKVRVDGRFVYWAGDKPIPGGVVFENFQLEARFKPGSEFRFAVEPLESSRLRAIVVASTVRASSDSAQD
jgi:hypothetical protein